MPADTRLALRVLLKDRSFALLAILVLALGICAVTTQFSVVNGVILRGFSFPHADRLVAVNFIDPQQTNFFGTVGQISAMDYDDVRPTQQSFERMANYLNGSTVNMTINGTPQRFTGAYVGEDFFRILGVKPVLGRDFTAADNQPGAGKVTLIGHQLWQREFGGAPDIVGRAVRINGKPAEIIGVMPPGFAFPTNEQLWTPIYNEFPPRDRKDQRAIAPAVVALLKPGVSLDQATLEMTGFARRLAEAYPDTNKLFATGEVQPLHDAFTPRQVTGILLVMLAFCAGVLVIACVNVMNMQFARAALRAKELAVRSSLGATRSRLIRQMLSESLVLAAIGAVLGIAAATWSVDFLDASIRNLENAPPSWITFEIDGPVLAFTVGATVLAALASGLIPAWISSRANAAEVLKEGGRGNTSRAVNVITRGLVVLQIVVTAFLLIGSLLMVRSIVAQQRLDFGYDTEGLMTARMGLMDGDYPTPEARQVFFDRLLRELRNQPEYEAAGLTNRFRMVFSGNGLVEINGREYKEDRDRPNTNFEQVSEGLFAVTGQRILEGRDFNTDDRDTKLPVAIVNASFAKKHFARESALGRQFRTVGNNGTNPGPWRTIVGVVSDVRMTGPFNLPNVDASGFYVPFYSTVFGPAATAPFANQFATVVVKPRPGVSVTSVANSLRREVARVDANLPLYFVATPKANIEGFIAQNRIIAIMFSIFGGVAVILASVGLYGVMSFSVNQRTQEFGVRMALGADNSRILQMVIGQAARQLALGLGIGVAVALAATVVFHDAISSVIVEVKPFDPLTYGGVILLLSLVSAVAALVPARRATRVDPMIALRSE